MNTITLYTADGREVTEVQVPPWRKAPEIYVWGERFFVLHTTGRYEEAAGVFFIPPAIRPAPKAKENGD